MKRVAIPSAVATPEDIAAFAGAVKQNLDMVTGQHANIPKLKALDPTTATLADAIARLNALLLRIQGDT